MFVLKEKKGRKETEAERKDLNGELSDLVRPFFSHLLL